MSLSQLDHIMIHLAAERVPVALSDGRTGRLVAWKPTRRGRREIHLARVEFPSTRRATISIRRLAGIMDDDGKLFPLPREESGGHADTDTNNLLHLGSRQGSRGDLPPDRLLAPQGAHHLGVRHDSGQRQPALLHSSGSGSAARGGDAVPGRTGDPGRHDSGPLVGRGSGVA